MSMNHLDTILLIDSVFETSQGNVTDTREMSGESWKIGVGHDFKTTLEVVATCCKRFLFRLKGKSKITL